MNAMKNSYEDIISRLGPGLWYDSKGVPRYDKFSPDLCGVYMKWIALVRIACQGCGKEFEVANEVQEWQLSRQDWKNWKVTYPKKDDIGSFHYGDPPIHEGCSGNTMNSIPLQVLEFWERGYRDPVDEVCDKLDRVQGKHWEWVRRPELEIEIDEEWAKPEPPDEQV